METAAGIVGMIFMAVVAPLWLFFHYSTQWRSSKSLSSEDQSTLMEMWKTAETMESRINNIERILDTETPDWRREI